jgi:hypothetical protein
VSRNLLTGLDQGLDGNLGVVSLPGAHRLDVSDNIIQIGDVDGQAEAKRGPARGIWVMSLDAETQWRVMTERIAGSERMARKQAAPPSFDTPFARLSASTYSVAGNELIRLFDDGLVVRLLADQPATTMSGNRIDLAGFGTGIWVQVGGSLQLSGNRVRQAMSTDELQGSGVVCESDSLVASANHVTASGAAFRISADPQRVAVVGNVTSSPIDLDGGSVSAPWDQLNVVIG